MVASPPPLVSYADSLHGWRAGGPGIEATNDGGRHWKIVFRWRRGDGASDATAIVRTSAAAGIVTFDDAEFVTNDGGAHWYVVDSRPDVEPVERVGRGSLLFESDGTAIKQVAPWPIEGLRCGGRWYHAVQTPIGDYGPEPRNICLGGPGAVLHTQIALRFDQHQDVRLRALTAAGLVYDVFDDGGQFVEEDTMPVGRPEESWSDRNHGWRWAIRRGLEATSDGGHTWRLVFPVEPSSGGDVDRPLRMTAATGLVGVSAREFLTNDAGRHWYQVNIPAPGSFFGRGTQLYAVGANTIEQAVVWPVRNLRCLGRWVHSAEYFNELTAGPKPRTICLQDRLTLPFGVVYSGEPTWEVVGRRLTDGVLYADVYDDDGTYNEPQVGTVVVRDGVATFTPR
jgi:hypothetical protein